MLEHCKTEWGKPDQQKEVSSGPRADAIKVTVYYESFCPASIDRIGELALAMLSKSNSSNLKI